MTGNQDRSETVAYRIALAVIIMLQFIAAFYFCTQKTGFHYDEYYSYYSSNVTAGLLPSDNAWMGTDEIKNEFRVLPGEGFRYGTVKLMQTYDVHPPFYYYILHTACSLSPGVFSKWQGLAVNLLFYLLSIPVLAGICRETLCKHSNGSNRPILGEEDEIRQKGLCQLTTLFTVFLYGFSPAIISGVMFVRMYVLLTFLCLLTVYVHLKIIGYVDEIRACSENKLQDINGRRIYKKKQIMYAIGSFALFFTGIQTHYYYIVFLFFAAAYMTLYIFIRKGIASDSRKLYETDIKNAAGYAGTVMAALMASVVYYPSMLSHIFRGYRGTEATQAFFDLGNLRERAGLFVGLLNDYLIYEFFYLLILEVLLLWLYQRYRISRSPETGAGRPFDHRTGFCAFVTIGYFAVVLKTALLNAEEAVRYEMPVYGLIILIIVLLIGRNLKGLSSSEERQKRKISAETVLFFIIMIAACLIQIVGLFKGRVLFLYKEDADSYEWAADHKDDTIVYIYNPVNQWMIWDDSDELMQYDRIFFISADNEDEITDTDVTDSDHIYAYAVRSDNAEKRLTDLSVSDGRTGQVTLIRELQYVDLYEIR